MVVGRVVGRAVGTWSVVVAPAGAVVARGPVVARPRVRDGIGVVPVLGATDSASSAADSDGTGSAAGGSWTLAGGGLTGTPSPQLNVA